MLIENLPLSRRDMLLQSATGFGALALAGLMDSDAASSQPVPFPPPLAAKLSHRPATAKSVIFLFMEGGPSPIDTFDPDRKSVV